MFFDFLTYSRPKFISKPVAKQEWYEMTANFTILDVDNFETFVENNEKVLVMFYASCKCRILGFNLPDI